MSATESNDLNPASRAHWSVGGGSGLLKDLRGDPHPTRIPLIMGRAADEIERLRASMAAIHWNSARADADRATLMAIHDECEHAVPELKTILSPNNEVTHAD